MQNHSAQIHKNGSENWKVTLAETGVSSTKSQRLLAIKEYLGDETFCLTYGDGVSDLNITELIQFHKKEKALLQTGGHFLHVLYEPTVDATKKALDEYYLGRDPIWKLSAIDYRHNQALKNNDAKTLAKTP